MSCIGGLIKNKRRINFIFLFIYIFTVLWFTVLKRSTGYHVAQFELFWSYKRWFAGDTGLGNEIMLNIAMFIPFGFLASTLSLPSQSQRMKYRESAIVMLSAVAFSLTIESLQLFLMRGLFEWDDVFSNMLGAGIGIILFAVLNRILPSRYRSIVITSIGLVFVLAWMCISVEEEL